jgi:hypothetical protein
MTADRLHDFADPGRAAQQAINDLGVGPKTYDIVRNMGTDFGLGPGGK